MRKILLILLASPIALFARTTGGVGHGDYHFGYISASAGYSSLSQNIPEVTTKGDIAWLVGAGYEFRMNNAWVSVGAQYMREKSVSTPDEYVYRTPFGGEDNHIPPRQISYYQYTIRQTDRQDWRSIDVPLMAGYYNNGFYVGAGFKVGFSIHSSISTKGEYDLAAKYTRYVGMLEDVQWMTKNNSVIEQKYDCKLRPQFSLLGEIGYDLLSTMQTNSVVCHMLKIGVYAEYGLRSVRPDDSLTPIQLQGMNLQEGAHGAKVTDAHMTPYYLSSQTEGKRVVPFYIGVKLTYLIGGSWSATRTWHQGCQCYNQ